MVIFDHKLKLHLGLDVLSNQKILKDIYFVPFHLHFFQFLKNIKNIAAARKVLKEVLKVSEDKKVSISEAITFPVEILINILDEFWYHLLLPAMLSELFKNSSCNFDQKYQIGFAFIIFLL